MGTRRMVWISLGLVVGIPGLCLVVFGLDWITPLKGDCDDCHDLNHKALGPSLLTASSVNNLCLSCHNTTQGSYGAVLTHQGLSCAACHDPHDQQGGNLRHVLTAVTTGLSNSPAAVTFTDNSTSSGDFVDTSNFDGICQVCHSTTNYYRWNTNPATHTSQGSDKKCTNCHFHNTGFQASGGNCIGCHNSVKDDTADATPSYAEGTRRRVVVGSGGDFAGNTSRLGGHVNGSDPTNFECVVCHAEGYVDTSGTPTIKENTNYHKNNQIELFNVDSHDAQSSTANPSFTGLFVVKNNSNDWNSTYAHNLTSFCAHCHDGGAGAGASVNFTRRGGSGGSSANPFGDGSGPLDVMSQFAATYSKHGLNPVTGYSGLGSPYTANHSTDPNGIKSAAFVSPWGSASTVECSDCHLGEDTAATPTYSHNAHGGRGLRWLLRDRTGKDKAFDTDTTLGGATDGGDETSNSSILCFACHNPSTYTTSESGSGSASRYEKHGQNGHSDSDANIYGIGCMNCHGGDTLSPFPSGSLVRGGIHGTGRSDAIDEVKVQGQTQIQNPYNRLRFTNGASLDRWNVSGSTVTCSAQGSPAGTIRGANLTCSQHGSQSYTRNY